MSAASTKLLAAYSGLLREQARPRGLIGMDDAQVADQVARSVALAELIPAGPNEMVVDVGTGAGLPGIPLCITLAAELPGRDAKSFYLVEPKLRAVAFLEKVIRCLDLEALVAPVRSEEAARDPQIGGKADFVVAKALAKPYRALQLCSPLCKVGGRIIVTARPGEDAASLGDTALIGLSAPLTMLLGEEGPAAQTVIICEKLEMSRD